MLVSMRLSDKHSVPDDVALLYDFVNSMDLRQFVEDREAHQPSDELATPAQLQEWLRVHGLLERDVKVSQAEHSEALKLRDALRTLLSAAPAERASATGPLDALAPRFPLVVTASQDRLLDVRPIQMRATSGLGKILVDLVRLSTSGALARLKTCDSSECRWIFFDRSKPSNGRWCSSDRCGNRAKTRAYRNRQRFSA